MFRVFWDYLFNPCKHEYEVLSEYRYPKSYLDFAGYCHQYEGKILLLKCTKCGNIKKFKF
jgi:hypothetical protein